MMQGFEIGVGTIVTLDSGDDYKVLEVKINKNKPYPHKVIVAKSTSRKLNDTIEDRYGDWWQYNWKIVSGGVPIDVKSKVIAKIKYLDEKFKKKQEEKELEAKAKATLMDVGNISWTTLPVGSASVWNESVELTTQSRITTDAEVYADYVRYVRPNEPVGARPWATNPYSTRRS